MKLKNNLYRIASADKDTRTFRLALDPDCMIYRAHFPEHPVTPGVCIIQMASELLGELFPMTFELSAVANAKYLAVIDPRNTPELTYAFNRVASDDEGRSVKVSVSVSDGGTVFTKLSLVYRIK